MFAYLVRRIFISLIIFFLGTVLIFSIIQLPPGDLVDYIIAQSGAGTGSAAEQMRRSFGLDQPLYQQYIKWVTQVVRGNFGYSFLYRKPVIEVIKGELFWTIVITGLGFGFAWGFGSIIGIYSAKNRYSFGDYFFTTFGFVGLSIPTFFLAMIIIYFMVSSGTGITGGLFSNKYITQSWSLAKFIDLLKHLWIPIVAIGINRMAEVIRILRGNLLDVLNQQYIQTARAKGLSENRVVIKHAVRVAINPLISLAGTLTPRLISGIIVTAVVLNLPVIGPTFIVSLKSQDMYLAGAYLLMILFLLIFGNIMADLLLAWTDPRIRFE